MTSAEVESYPEIIPINFYLGWGAFWSRRFDDDY